MKVLITGGTGLIGSALTESLKHDGHEVIILTRNPKQKAPFGAQLVRWDARTGEGWAEHLDGADAIVNLAGAPLDKRWTDEYRKRIRDSRVDAGAAVIDAIRRVANKPGVLVQASAVGYYGVHEEEKITEDSPPGNDFLAEVCQAWEGSTAEAEALGVRRVITRTGIVLSKRGGALPRMLLPFRFFAGGPVGSGEQYYSWIHILDQIGAIRFLIDHPTAQGAYNLTAPEPVRNKVFTRELGEAMNRPSFMPAPGLALKAAFGEMSTIILDGQRVIPQRLLREGYQFRFTDLETAFRHLLYSGGDY